MVLDVSVHDRFEMFKLTVVQQAEDVSLKRQNVFILLKIWVYVLWSTLEHPEQYPTL